MGVDAAPTQGQPVSPATWGALGALILLLGALAVLLVGCLTKPPRPEGGIPNHYTCECECTKGYSAGARIRTAQPVNVRPTPAAPTATLVPAGVEGTIIDGPVDAIFNGVNLTWWQVQFDTNVVGWTPPTFLTVLSSDPLMSEELDVCLPASLNPNVGGQTPTIAEIANDCSDRVEDWFGDRLGQDRPPGSECKCEAKAFPTPAPWDVSCDADCTEPSGVCTVMGTDPEQPTPQPFTAVAALTTSSVVFRPTSVCEVEGPAHISIDGHEPKQQPTVRGVLQIHGRPCPGGNCQVTLAYQLWALDAIEFDSGTIFASDPKFVEVSLSGASEPEAIELGDFLGFNLGELPRGAALTSGRGRRSGSSNARVIVGRNSEPLALAVNWDNNTCRLSGGLVGEVDGDEDEPLDVDIQVELNGVIVNQPPRANAGADETVECTSPDGAAVTLSASSSADPDNNLALYLWRRDSENGPQVVPPSPNPALTTQQALGETNYYLRVVDSRFSADHDSVTVTVVDTQAPAIDCHAPATIPKHDQPIAFRATATDTCGPAPAVLIENVECFKESPKGRIKVNPSCKVSIQGDTLTIGNSAGADVIRWSTRTADGPGNATTKTCEVRVD